MYKLILLTVFVVFGNAKQISFKDCGSLGGSIQSLAVSPCDSDPCTFKRGDNETWTVTFVAKENATQANAVVHGIVGGIPVPFPVPEDGCTNHFIKCPIVAGTTVQYNSSVYISPSYPKVRVEVKFEIQDENKKDIICFIIPIAVD